MCCEDGCGLINLRVEKGRAACNVSRCVRGIIGLFTHMAHPWFGVRTQGRQVSRVWSYPCVLMETGRVQSDRRKQGAEV